MKYVLLLLLLTCPIFSKPILISFDDTASISCWEETLDFAKENKVKLTYFVSAASFVTQEEGKNYWGLKELKTQMNMDFVKPKEAYFIKARFIMLERAIAEGHELASHLCGHYAGGKFTREQWDKEFAYTIMVFKNYPMFGVRAPYLEVNDAYFEIVKELQWYDSSLCVNSKGKYFTKDYEFDYNSFEIPVRAIKIITEGGPLLTNGKKTFCIPFDTSFVEEYSRCSELDRETFFKSLCYDYLNRKSPTQICLHFSKDGLKSYRYAMEDFVKWVKIQKDKPNFVTYKEYYESKN